MRRSSQTVGRGGGRIGGALGPAANAVTAIARRMGAYVKGADTGRGAIIAGGMQPMQTCAAMPRG